MREIKFRAWSEKLKNYAGVWGVYPHEGGAYQSGPYTGRGAPYINEQFTGLYDKNGNEIYEGDIIRGDGEWVVIFEYSQWGLDCLIKGRTHDWLPFDDCDIGKCEVIGNIHENPELLQEVSE